MGHKRDAFLRFPAVGHALEQADEMFRLPGWTADRHPSGGNEPDAFRMAEGGMVFRKHGAFGEQRLVVGAKRQLNLLWREYFGQGLADAVLGGDSVKFFRGLVDQRKGEVVRA